MLPGHFTPSYTPEFGNTYYADGDSLESGADLWSTLTCQRFERLRLVAVFRLANTTDKKRRQVVALHIALRSSPLLLASSFLLLPYAEMSDVWKAG